MTDKKDKPVDELRFAVGPHASGGVGIEFRKPISWIVLSKQEAVHMGFLLLEHAGVKMSPVPEPQLDDHTAPPEAGPTS